MRMNKCLAGGRKVTIFILLSNYQTVTAIK